MLQPAVGTLRIQTTNFRTRQEHSQRTSHMFIMLTAVMNKNATHNYYGYVHILSKNYGKK
jgi:hypothetical protein